MKNNIDKKGYTNRKTHGLPKKKTKIEIIVPSKTFGEEIYRCSWKPYDENNHPKNEQPGKGYLGTATIISGKYEGIGFHAWEQNDSEFIYYKIILK